MGHNLQRSFHQSPHLKDDKSSQSFLDHQVYQLAGIWQYSLVLSFDHHSSAWCLALFSYKALGCTKSFDSYRWLHARNEGHQQHTNTKALPVFPLLLFDISSCILCTNWRALGSLYNFWCDPSGVYRTNSIWLNCKHCKQLLQRVQWMQRFLIWCAIWVWFWSISLYWLQRLYLHIYKVSVYLQKPVD